MTDTVGGSGTKTVTDITLLQFSDVVANLSIAAGARTIGAADLNSLAELYVVFFNCVPEARPPGVDLSPRRGGDAQPCSAAWPFASLGPGKAGGETSGWTLSFVDGMGGYWRAALAKMVSAVRAAVPVLPTTSNPSVVPNPADGFETPPGVGSPRGGK